jgi:hypothetical protein
MSNQFKDQFEFKTPTFNTPNFGFKSNYVRPKPMDMNSVEGLESYMNSVGLRPPKEKRNFLLRFVDFISRPMHASAGFSKALLDGDPDTNPLAEAWRGLSGKERVTYSQVLEQQGMENKYSRGTLGFVLDVALDPLTYFGGWAVKGGLATMKATAKAGGSVMRKFNPLMMNSLEMAGKGLRDAVGHAFDINYGLTRKMDKAGKVTGTMVSDYMSNVGAFMRGGEEIMSKNKKLFQGHSRETLRQAQDIMAKNRSIEWGLREGVDGVTTKDFLPIPAGEVGEAVVKMKTLGEKMGVSLKANAVKNAKSKAEKEAAKAFKPYEWYVPGFQSADEMAKEMFVPLTKRMKVGKEDYLKKFENKVLPAGKTLMDPIEAYTRVEASMLRDNLMREFFQDAVKAYGFKSTKEALKKGVDPSTLREVFEKGAMGGRRIGYLKANDYRIIEKVNNVENSAIDMLAKASGFDSFTRIFKTAVTSYFPAFHARNFVSSVIQNYSQFGAQAFNPKNTQVGLAILAKPSRSTDRLIESVFVGRTAKEVRDAFMNRFDRSGVYIGDVGRSITQDMTGNLSFQGVRDPGRWLGNNIELFQKAQGAAIAAGKGDSLERALYLAEKAGFDYRMITDFESKVLKRMIPFYTFARRNAELQVSTMIKNPERILNQIKFTQNLSEVFGGGAPTEEDLKGLPEWALNSLGFKIEGGRFLTKFGLPIEEFLERIDKPMKTTLTSINPLIKYPLESYLGYDFFRDRKLIDINKIAPGTAELIMSDKAPEWIKDIFNIRQYEKPDGTISYMASPRALHVLRSIPSARLQGTLESLFDGDRASVDKWLAFFTGIRIYDIDLELQQHFRERDMVRDMQDMLLQHNVGKEFRQFYVPKQ